MSDIAKTVLLDQAEWLEFSPTMWKPQTDDEKLAALVAYNTGDGSISLSSASYIKENGDKSTYAVIQSAFYSNIESDLDDILIDLKSQGMAKRVTVKLKKNSHKDRVDGYQVQLSKTDTEVLLKLGAPLGKKTKENFFVPEWVMLGALGVKRAYVAALFGAEGNTPSFNKNMKSKMPKQMTLSMCKIEGNSLDVYFAQLSQILSDLGVGATVTVSGSRICFGSSYITWYLNIKCGVEGMIAFYENVGFAYCVNKSILGWQWLKYLKAYQAEANRRRSVCLTMRADGESYEAIGKGVGLTRGAAWRLLSDIDDGKGVNAGHSFPHFKDWIAARWNDELKLLKINISHKTLRDKPTEVWNMLVGSSDHSYLLESGVNNFNSFETMSGRVYYPFDRRIHVKECAFDNTKPIWVGQDFNLDPMSSVIFQPQENGDIWVVDEIILKGSNTEEVCDELERRYWRQLKQIYLYPDPASQYKQHARGESDLDIFRERGFTRQRYHRKHPPVADRVNAVNRMLKSADGRVRMYIAPHCKGIISSFEQTIYKRGSREIDKDADTEHSADAAGYCIHYNFPVRKIEIMGVSI